MTNYQECGVVQFVDWRSPKSFVSINPMETATEKTGSVPAAADQSFMAPIWKITLMTMLGTACIGYALNLFTLEKRHKENMQEVAKVEFRTKQYAAYRDIYKTQGKAAADASLKNN